MGGINHQPCGAYLKNSTRLSRFLSLAKAELELANVALEDVILSEYGDGDGDVGSISRRLRESVTRLDDMAGVIADLRKQMNDSHYEDLPSLKTVNLSWVGERFVDNKMVSQDAWNMAQQAMQGGGFYRMLDVFNEHVADLRMRTTRLIEEVDGLHRHTGEVSMVLEENRVGNIRPAFAELYTGWNGFHALFLASALLSTELWYRFNGFGSLTGDTAVQMVA